MFCWDDALTMGCEADWEAALERLTHYTDLQHRHFTEPHRVAAALTEDLKSVAGRCGTDRIPKWPAQCLEGITTGCVHPLERAAPLVLHQYGYARLPTEEELLRIKAVLILMRNCQRDYTDLMRLTQRMPQEKAVAALVVLDQRYPLSSGESPVQQLCVQLATPQPWDSKGCSAWGAVCQCYQQLSIALFRNVK